MHFDPKLKTELKEYVLQKIRQKNNKVTLISPYSLTSEELSIIKRELPFLKESEIENSIDTSLIAGIVIKFGSKMIDLSIKGELRHIKNMLEII